MMPTSIPIIEQIKALCLAYKVHLIGDDAAERIFYANVGVAERLLIEKVNIIRSLYACNNIQDILIKLSDPSSYQRSKLQENRTGSARFVMQAFLTLISFPISLPVLVFWSWWTRGTLNFLKPDGAILVDKILKLCQAPQSLNVVQTDDNATQLNTVEGPYALSKAFVNNVTPSTNENNESEGINIFLTDLSNAFFSPSALQERLELNLKRYTGSPYILNSRVRPFSFQEDRLLFDTHCGFQWSDQKPELATIAMLLNLDPVFADAAIESNPLQVRGKPTSLMGFFSSESVFQNALNKARKMKGSIDKREEGYLLALKHAETAFEKTLALEGLINELSSFHTYTGNHYRYDLETGQLKQAEVLAKINSCINQLPANYLSITPSAISLQQEFNTISEHLQNNRVVDAWSLFSNMPPLSAFIQYNFLHLVVMWHQLNGVFNLIIVEGYLIRTIEMSAPEEQEIKDDELNSLYIHVENDLIYCSVKNKLGNIDKFIIEDRELGDQAVEVRALFKKGGGVFSDGIKDQIYRIVSQKGYYRSTMNSIDNALFNFSKAHDFLKQYRPACANRLLNETIEPLQGIILAGKSANKTTPDAVRRDIAIRQRAEIDRKLQNREKIVHHKPPYDEATWDSLLDTNHGQANSSKMSLTMRDFT